MHYRSWVFLALFGIAGVSSAEEPAPQTPERLAPSDIMAVVLAHKPAIIQCVKAQKKEEPDRSGKLVIRWEIRKDGTTWDVKCDTPELCKALLAHCLTKEIQEWTFPQHKVEGDPVLFPFTF